MDRPDWHNPKIKQDLEPDPRREATGARRPLRGNSGSHPTLRRAVASSLWPGDGFKRRMLKPPYRLVHTISLDGDATDKLVTWLPRLVALCGSWGSRIPSPRSGRVGHFTPPSALAPRGRQS